MADPYDPTLSGKSSSGQVHVPAGEASVPEAPPTIPAAPAPAREESIQNLVKDLFRESRQLLQSEVRVVRNEIQETTRAALSDVLKAAVFGGVALAGLLCLLAFVVLALGDVLAGSSERISGYWLSALITGIGLAAIGGGLAFTYARRIGSETRLERTQAELERNRRFFEAEARDLTEAVRP